MKNFKKMLASVLAFAMVLGMIGVMPAMEAKAATDPVEVKTVKFDPYTAILNVELSGTVAKGDLVYLSVGDVKNGSVKAYTTYEIAAAEVGSSTKSYHVYLDLSSYAKKDTELSMYVTTNDATNTKKIKIAKNAAKIKVNLKLDESTLVKRFEVTGIADTDKPNLYYRTETGEWAKFYNGTDLSDAFKADLAKFEQYGTTLYFKVAGAEAASTATDIKFASADAKLKYPKLGKAPSVVVDYPKNKVSFPAKVEIKGIKAKVADTANTTAWTALDSATSKKAVLTLDEIFKTDTASAGYTFYARMAANGKKPTSAISKIVIPAQGTAPTADKVVIAANVDSKGAFKGINVKNDTGSAIEIALLDKDKTPDADTKWTTMKISTTKAFAGAKTDLRGKKLFARFPGVKENAKTDAIEAKRVSQQLNQTVAIPEATVGNVTVTGTVDSSTLTNATVTITLVDCKVVAVQGTSVNATSWFTNIPAGLAAAPNAEAKIGDGTIVIKFTGTPTATSDKAMTIKIPKAVVGTAEDLVVNLNDSAKYAIAAKPAS